jgi:hypothetical protein
MELNIEPLARQVCEFRLVHQCQAPRSNQFLEIHAKAMCQLARQFQSSRFVKLCLSEVNQFPEALFALSSLGIPLYFRVRQQIT